MTEPLPYGRQWLDRSDVDAVVDCLGDPYLTQGPRIAEFEAALCGATGAKHAVSVSNGTAALHLAVLAARLSPGEIGITSPITFVATANAVRYAGGRVAFADVDPATGLIDPESVARVAAQAMREGLRVAQILPVDFAGQPADVPAVRAVADRIGARVIADSAHALGAEFEAGGATHSVGSCRFAHAATLSFHPVKHITTAEGGAILTSDDELHQRLVDLRNHGIVRDHARLRRPADDPMRGGWWYEQHDLGFNYRLPDVLCALGLSQLSRLAQFVDRRRALADAYDRGIAERDLEPHLAPLARIPGRKSSWHLYVVRVGAGENATDAEVARARKSLYDHLREAGVLCQVHYIPVHWQPEHAGTIVPEGGCPGAERYYAGCLSLPMFPAMQDSDVDRVLDAVSGWADARR